MQAGALKPGPLPPITQWLLLGMAALSLFNTGGL